MPPAPLHVLLLGWNDAPRTGELVPALGSLVGNMTPAATVSVVVPHQPTTALGQAAHVTALADLTPEQASAPVSLPQQRPAAWQRPAAPYTGTAADSAAALPSGASGGWSTPAAPYLGATPGLPDTATSAVLTGVHGFAAAEERPAVIDQRAARVAVQHSVVSQLEAEASELPAQDLLLNRDVFAQDAEPDSGEATDLHELANNLSPHAENRTAAHATLPEALAVLSLDLAPDADLNFQVIQYARFATRQALQDTFSVIYASDWPTWLAGLEIRQQTGRPLVLHVHSLAQERATPADRGWALELERLALRRADLVLAASDELAHLLQVRYQLGPERLQLVDPADTETLRGLLLQLETRPPGR
ncbi:glycosyltransferase [Hymenobacter endophyticus]|uniref:Glycosyltransferase n=1 Tax=Hymenobacter endophyticus TaxID=3076335 RepID=A0ABU3TIL4_9BACT|nr:glycosyltransferase [Hymenobacter endophyticus]MDU0371207.1 glycosyltransferase [Hymenobacter endophyticus]